MRKFMTFSCLLCSLMLPAQITNLPTILNLNSDQEDGGRAFGIVPTSLSYDGTNRVYIRTADDQVAIYTNGFAPVKQFNISPNDHGYQMRPATREVTVTVTYGEVSKDYLGISSDPTSIDDYYDETKGEYIYTYEIPATWTNTDIAQMLQTRQNYPILRIEATEEGTIFFQDRELYREDGTFDDSNYYMPETYGKQYPRDGYIVRNNYLYWCNQNYRTERSATYSYGDWVESGEYETRTSVQDWGLPFVNCDYDDHNYDYEEGDGLCLTQTLFNKDAQYEYLYFPISSYATRDYNNYPNQPDCQDCYEKTTTFTQEGTIYYEPVYTGFEVKSETGATLQSVSFPNGFVMIYDVHAQIIKLSNEYHLLCFGELNSNPAMLVYKINPDSKNSVQQVMEPVRIAAFPNPVKRNQTITVQFAGENVKNMQTELQVTNIQGQTTEKRIIPAGQKQVVLPATNFAPGMNIIRVHQQGEEVGSIKVVVN